MTKGDPSGQRVSSARQLSVSLGIADMCAQDSAVAMQPAERSFHLRILAKVSRCKLNTGRLAYDLGNLRARASGTLLLLCDNVQWEPTKGHRKAQHTVPDASVSDPKSRVH